MIYEITPRIWKKSPRVNYRVLFFMVSLAVFFFNCCQLSMSNCQKFSKLFSFFFERRRGLLVLVAVLLKPVERKNRDTRNKFKIGLLQSRMAVPSTDWQLGCKQLNQRGAHLLQTGQWADCVFMVGPPPHQVTVTAHKLILASASPVFEAMFFGGMAERDSPIPILDVQPDAFKALLM